MLLVICLIFKENLVIQSPKMFPFFLHQKFCKGSSVSCPERWSCKEWSSILIISIIDYFGIINCWVTLVHLQKVIPFHAGRYKQIILNSTIPLSCIAPHDLSFATSFIVAALFSMVKASRPMTYKYLTVEMIKSIGKNGIINQTLFKTNEKYSFNSLLFSVDVLTLVTGYVNYIRPTLNAVCNYLLVCRNGKQISKLTNIVYFVALFTRQL